MHLIQAPICFIHSYRMPMGLYGHRNMALDLVENANEGGEGGRGGGSGGRDEYDYVPNIPAVAHHPSRLRSATNADIRAQAPPPLREAIHL